MFRSLRWQLLIWNALILLVVEIGFGAALYLKIRQAGYDEIDAELLAAAGTIDGALRGLARPILEGKDELPPPPNGAPPGLEFFDLLPGGDPDRPPPPPSRRSKGGARRRATESERNGEIPERTGIVRPSDEGPSPRPQGGTDEDGPSENRRPPIPHRQNVRQLLSLPKPFVNRFATEGSKPFMTAWAANGKVLQSDRVPAGVSTAPPDLLSEKVDHAVVQQGQYRLAYLRGPQGTRILVGRSTIDELAKLDGLRWQIATIGAGIFIVGLTGSWWLARRIVRPIAKMSATAALISASNLGQRIDLDEIDLELTTLGSVLNEMLGRLEASFEQQINFSADASHELRTPLTVIMTNAELALSRPRTPEEYRETLEACLRASQRMKRLVEQLLVLARGDAGRLELQLQQLDLVGLVGDCVGLVEPLARQRGIGVSLQGGHVAVDGDADRLSQVVINLLSNAIAYNHPQGKVDIRIWEHHGKAMLAITDTGVGISAADVPRVFDRFYRVDKARSRHRGGSGLGLAICKLIVEAHGGEIHLTSLVGQGTTVEIELPLHGTSAS